MQSPLPGVRTPTPPAGLIDTLQAGFDLVNRHPWLLLIPVAVDLVIWLGPQLTIGPLLQQLVLDAIRLSSADQPGAAAVEEQAQALVAAIHQGETFSRYNLLSLIAMRPLGIPSFAADGIGRGPALAIDSPGVAALLAVVFVACGLALAVVFYGLIGRAIREGGISFGHYGEEYRTLLLRVLGLLGVVLAGLTAVGVPAGLALLLPDSGGIPLRSAASALLFWIGFWILVYVSFAPDAVYVTMLRPLDAVKASFHVVRSNFWSAIAIIGLITIIELGFAAVWENAVRILHEPGILLAIFGHIYISTGLAAASMSYYRDRFGRLPRPQTVPTLE